MRENGFRFKTTHTRQSFSAGTRDPVMISTFNYLLVLTFLTLCSSSDFSLKGDPCSKLDSCYSKSALKTCSCDNIACHEYGTCCHDVGKPPQDPSGFQCYNHRDASPTFAKRSCAEDFRGHVGDKLECLDGDEDEMDVSNNIPMTSLKTKTTYWNRNCARCNNEADTDLEFWNIEVFCPSHKEVDRGLIRTNLTFDQDKHQWGLVIDGEFLQCIVKYSPSSYIEEVKQCTPNLVASCPIAYNNEDVSTKCLQYYAERKLKNSDVYFKNIHCAICNGADVKELECPGMLSHEDNVEENDFQDMVEVIFTSGTWLEKEPGKRFECSTGFSYDPFRKKCRREEIKEYETAISNTGHDCRHGSLVILVAFATHYLIKYSAK